MAEKTQRKILALMERAHSNAARVCKLLFFSPLSATQGSRSINAWCELKPSTLSLCEKKKSFSIKCFCTKPLKYTFYLQICVDDSATCMNNTDQGSVAASGNFTVCLHLQEGRSATADKSNWSVRRLSRLTSKFCQCRTSR